MLTNMTTKVHTHCVLTGYCYGIVLSYQVNTAQNSSSAEGLEHEETADSKDDDCMDVGCGEGGF